MAWAGNLLATEEGDLVYLDFGMMSEAPQPARYAIIAHVVHLVNRDYRAMCQDYYTLDFMDRSVDTTPIAPALATFFDDVLDRSVAELNFKVCFCEEVSHAGSPDVGKKRCTGGTWLWGGRRSGCSTCQMFDLSKEVTQQTFGHIMSDWRYSAA